MFSVSVIVPVKNEEDTLNKFLESWRNQTIPFELIIVDTHSTDNTEKLAQEYADLVLDLDGSSQRAMPITAMARNIGAKHASGEIQVHTDADVVLSDPHQLERIIGKFVDGKMDVATVRMRYRKSIMHGLRELAKKALRVVSGIIVVRKDVFFELGCFPLSKWHDLKLSNRAILKRHTPKGIDESPVYLRPVHDVVVAQKIIALLGFSSLMGMGIYFFL